MEKWQENNRKTTEWVNYRQNRQYRQASPWIIVQSSRCDDIEREKDLVSTYPRLTCHRLLWGTSLHHYSGCCTRRRRQLWSSPTGGSSLPLHWRLQFPAPCLLPKGHGSVKEDKGGMKTDGVKSEKEKSNSILTIWGSLEWVNTILIANEIYQNKITKPV